MHGNLSGDDRRASVGYILITTPTTMTNEMWCEHVDGASKIRLQ